VNSRFALSVGTYVIVCVCWWGCGVRVFNSHLHRKTTHNQVTIWFNL
jgi:hypothetical protein